jgi:hypothetical protein
MGGTGRGVEREWDGNPYIYNYDASPFGVCEPQLHATAALQRTDALRPPNPKETSWRRQSVGGCARTQAPDVGRFLIRPCDLVGAPRGRFGPFFCLPGRGGHLVGPATKWCGRERPAGHAAVPPAVPHWPFQKPFLSPSRAAGVGGGSGGYSQR